MDKICYCPQCGEIDRYYGSLEIRYCSNCDNNIPFTKRHKNSLMIATDFSCRSLPSKKGNLPMTALGFTERNYVKVWDTYVDIPENDKLDRVLFEKTKKEILDFFAQGGWDGTIKDLREKPSSKDASVIGRGVVGGIAAGPVGAVVGALSAVDKNMKNANKKK